MKSSKNNQTGIRPWSVILLVLAVIGIYYFLPQLSEIGSTITALKRIDGWWFLVGLALMTCSFFVATLAQYIAGGRIGSYKKLFALQMRGTFANHFLPFSVGTLTVMTRYYEDFVSKTRAALIAATPTIGLVIVSLLLLAIASPGTISDAPSQLGIKSTEWIVPVLLLAFVCLLGFVLVFWQHVRRFMNQIKAATSTANDVKQFIGVLIVSAVTIGLYGAVLWASSQAANAGISFLEAVALYIVMWFVGSIVPTPGGIGASEAALTFGMTSIGVHFQTAVVAMLTFRLISFWLPILPGALFVSQRFRRD